MPERPVIAISTLPRVGSMWAFNVARALAGESGHPVVPETALKHDADMFAAADRWMREGPENAYCIIKVHQPLNPLPGLKVIYLTRDIRDRMYSICRFDHRELNEQSAREMVRNHLLMDKHYAGWPAEQLLQLPFEQLEQNSKPLIESIAAFMGIDSLGTEQLAAIEEKFSKRSVRRLVEGLSDQQDNQLSGKSNVVGTTASKRDFDDQTGFQTGHVSDYHSGDWQHLWTEEQQAIVDAAIEAEQGH